MCASFSRCAFMQFRKWRIGCHVQPIALEVSLVSEVHQYGGTPDCIALIDGKVALVEFKTSAKPFADHLVAMAAHAQLWSENNQGRPIEAFHWIGLPKDGSEFKHHAYADLPIQWEIFLLYLDAWRLEKGLTRKPVKPAKPALDHTDRNGIPAFLARSATLRAPEATVLPFNQTATPPATAAAPKRARKPKPVAQAPTLLAPPPVATLSMAEILRSYGHVREVSPC